jgi:ribosome-binding factor A
VVSKLRVQRIADRIREDLSEILLQEASDPRLGGVSITDVKVDRELGFADIYFSAIEGSSRAAEIQAGFEHSKGFLRRSLAQRIDLRVFPNLRFHWDPTYERAERIERIIASLHADEARSPEGMDGQAKPTEEADEAEDAG